MKFQRNDPTLKERRRELRRNQTDAERLLWSRLRNKQLCGAKFFRQYSFGPYILDFYCPATKMAVELDGGQHGLPENMAYDQARTEYLNADGILVVRFWNSDVMDNMDGVLAQLELEITKRSVTTITTAGE